MVFSLPYYIFAWIASFSYGLVVITSKLASKYSIPNPWMFAFLYNLLVLLFTIPMAVSQNVTLPQFWPNVVYAGLFTATSVMLYVLALYKLDVSVISPLFNFRIIFSLLLGAVLLREALHLNQYFLIMLMFAAGMVVSYDSKLHFGSFFRWPVMIAVLGTLSLALMGVYINKAVAVNGLWSTTLFSLLIAQVCLVLTVPLFIQQFKKITKTQVAVLSIIAVIDAIATVAANRAYAGNVSISSAIISLPFSMFMAIALAALKPKLLEKHPNHVYAVRVTVAIIMFIAAFKLST